MESKYKLRIILIRATKISIILKINKFNQLNSDYFEETKIKYFLYFGITLSGYGFYLTITVLITINNL